MGKVVTMAVMLKLMVSRFPFFCRHREVEYSGVSDTLSIPIKQIVPVRCGRNNRTRKIN